MRTKKGRKKDLLFQGNYTKEERIRFSAGEGDVIYLCLRYSTSKNSLS